MTLWEANKKDGTLVGYVPDAILSKKLVACGTPLAARRAFEQAKSNPVDMQLAKPIDNIVEKSKQDVPDFVIWSWMAIFSDRVVSMAIEMGCLRSEFWPCRFQTNPGENFFFHLPEKTFDIVDMEKSTFRHILPLNPPIPMFFEHLVIERTTEYVPPCFRVEIPKRGQIFQELLVRDDFRLAWENKGFTGATFRCLGE